MLFCQKQSGSQRCAILPRDFEKNVNALLQNMFSCGADRLAQLIDAIVANLDEVI